jgi:hypothetical protein
VQRRAEEIRAEQKGTDAGGRDRKFQSRVQCSWPAHEIRHLLKMLSGFSSAFHSASARLCAMVARPSHDRMLRHVGELDVGNASPRYTVASDLGATLAASHPTVHASPPRPQSLSPRLALPPHVRRLGAFAIAIICILVGPTANWLPPVAALSSASFLPASWPWVLEVLAPTWPTSSSSANTTSSPGTSNSTYTTSALTLDAIRQPSAASIAGLAAPPALAWSPAVRLSLNATAASLSLASMLACVDLLASRVSLIVAAGDASVVIGGVTSLSLAQAVPARANATATSAASAASAGGVSSAAEMAALVFVFGGATVRAAPGGGARIGAQLDLVRAAQFPGAVPSAFSSSSSVVSLVAGAATTNLSFCAQWFADAAAQWNATLSANAGAIAGANAAANLSIGAFRTCADVAAADGSLMAQSLLQLQREETQPSPSLFKSDSGIPLSAAHASSIQQTSAHNQRQTPLARRLFSSNRHPRHSPNAPSLSDVASLFAITSTPSSSSIYSYAPTMLLASAYAQTVCAPLFSVAIAQCEPGSEAVGFVCAPCGKSMITVLVNTSTLPAAASNATPSVSAATLSALPAAVAQCWACQAPAIADATFTRCVCPIGMIRTAATTAASASIAATATTRVTPAVMAAGAVAASALLAPACVPCPSGFRCADADVALDAIALRPGAWRSLFILFDAVFSLFVLWTDSSSSSSICSCRDVESLMPFCI